MVLLQWSNLFIFISKSSLLSLLKNTFWDISNNFDHFFPENLSIFWIFLHTVVVIWVTKAKLATLRFAGSSGSIGVYGIGVYKYASRRSSRNTEGNLSEPCFTSGTSYRCKLPARHSPVGPGGSHRVTSYLLLPHSPSMVSWVKPCQLLPFSGHCQECLIQAAP